MHSFWFAQLDFNQTNARTRLVLDIIIQHNHIALEQYDEDHQERENYQITLAGVGAHRSTCNRHLIVALELEENQLPIVVILLLAWG